MSTKIKERLKKLALELDHEERMILDEGLVRVTKAKDCDSAIEMLTDDQVREIVAKVKRKKKRALLEYYATNN
jgi:hypothetical protein